MNKPSANSLSLASLFTIMTAAAVVIWIAVNAPWFACCLVVYAIPGAFRLRMWIAAGDTVGRSFTLTETLLALVTGSFVGALMLHGAGVTFIGVVTMLSLAAPRPTTEAIGLGMFSALAVTLTAAYFLFAEAWLFPSEFTRVHRRLPTWSECARHLLKATSLYCATHTAVVCVALWVFYLLPPFPRLNDANVAGVFALIVFGSAAAVSTYRISSRWFHVQAVRAATAAALFAIVPLASLARFSDGGGVAAIAAVAVAFISLPGMNWPPRPQWNPEAAAA